MRRYLAYAVLMLLVAFESFASNKIMFTKYELNNYPEVKAEFFMYSNRIIPDYSINKSALELQDNGIVTNIKDFNIPYLEPLTQVSLTLSLDLSVNNDGTNSNFYTAKKLLNSIIDSLPKQNIETALSSFDIIAYLNSDFTNNKQKLKDEVLKLTSRNGAILNKGFNYYPAGSIEVSKKARFAKNILLITDGNKQINADEIISKAKEQNIKIFAFTLSKTASQDLKKICVETGGRCFEDINLSNYEDFISQFISFLYNYKPCEITFDCSLDCEAIHSISLKHTEKNIEGIIDLTIPDAEKPTLEILPPFLQFSSVVPNFDKDINVTLMAKNIDITIEDIGISMPEFTVVSGWTAGNSLTIPKNTAHNLTVRYTPTDSNIVFAMMTITSNACFGKIIYMTAGFPNMPPKNKTLNITTPNGGENLIAGDTAEISWTGLLPSDVIQLEYTTDAGNKWDTLALDVTGLNYQWEVPARYSNQCLIRSIQLWPNNIGQTLDFKHSGIVNVANFNKLDGSMVITACDDGVARIWNSYTGSVVYDLIGHTGKIHWANFSPDERYAISASADKTIKIWDKNTGAEINTLFGHTDEVTAANFNNTGTKVISSGFDGKVFLWDVATGAIDETIYSGGSKVRFANFSNDSKDVIYCVGSKAIIYDLNAKQIKREFNTNNITVYNAAYSQAGDKIATADINGKAIVWDVNTGDTIFSVSHGENIIIYHASFSQDDNYLLTSGTDFTAKKWDAHTGAYLTKLEEHRNAVKSAFYNFDGSRILTSSLDSTAKVWNLNKRDLQMDSTDAYFSIVKPEVIGGNINFKRVPIDEVKDSVLYEFIRNNTPYEFEIRDIFISGDNAEEFRILEGFAPYTIGKLEFKPITISFSPKAVGARKAIINIVYPLDTLKLELIGEGYEPGLQLLTEVIDFSSVELGDFKDTVITAIAKNRSLSPVTINSIQNIGPDTEHFRIISQTENITIPASGVMPISIRFTPEDVISSNGIVLLNYNQTGSPAKISLYGQGIGYTPDTVSISITEVSGKPGEIIEVPILLNYFGSSTPKMSAINADLLFNSTLLEPVNSDYPSEVIGNTRKLKLTLNTDFETSKTSSIYFKVGLGNDTISELKLENAEPVENTKTKIITNSGLFKLNGYCTEGGNRLFNPNGKFSLSQNIPNPSKAQTVINFSTNEKGIVKLYLIDLHGRVLDVFVNNYLEPGEYKYNVNTSGLASGCYYYILETPSQRKTMKMDIE